MNYVSIKANLREYKYEMILKTSTALFHCEANPINSSDSLFEINEEDLIRLRDFLNLFFPKKE